MGRFAYIIIPCYRSPVRPLRLLAKTVKWPTWQTLITKVKSYTLILLFVHGYSNRLFS